jgi:hypothetical protein
MFQIHLTEEIEAPRNIVWGVISDLDDYPSWNKFVVNCISTLEVGSAIDMKVMLFPFMAISQKETILANDQGEFLEYGINMPLGMLFSSRKHILTETGTNSTNYKSVFVLRGWLSPVMGFLIGSQLRRGFRDMTWGIAERAQDIYAKRNV